MPTMGQSDTTAGPITMDGGQSMTLSNNDLAVANGGRQGGVPSGYTNLIPLVSVQNNGLGTFVRGVSSGIELGIAAIAVFGSDGALTPEAIALAGQALANVTGNAPTDTTIQYPGQPVVNTPGPTLTPSDPVTLPTTPPAGYGSDINYTSVGEAVWGFVTGGRPTAWQVMEALDNIMDQAFYAGGWSFGAPGVGWVPLRGAIVDDIASVVVYPNFGKLPPNEGENVVSYMNRVSSVGSWVAAPFGGAYVAGSSFAVADVVGAWIVSQQAYDNLYASVWYPPGVPAAVWDFVVTDGGSTTPVGEMLRRVAQGVHVLGAQGVLTDNGFFKVLWADTVAPYPTTFAQPVFPYADIATDDTLVSFLTRVNPTYTVSGPDSAGVVELVAPGATDYLYLSTVTPALFDYLQFRLYTPASGPPARLVVEDFWAIMTLLPVLWHS